MQQLAPNPLRFWEGDSQTVRAYLRNWLHRNRPNKQLRLLAGTQPGIPLRLDALDWSQLLADTAEFYGVPLPIQGLDGLLTLEDIEAYVQQQLLKSAA